MTNVAIALERAATDAPDAVALIVASTGASLTYAELEGRVERMASALAGEGVQPGDRVVVVERNTLDHVVGWFGALRAGAVVVDLTFLLAAEEQRFILEDAAPKVVLSEADLVDDSVIPTGSHHRSIGLWQQDHRHAACSTRAADDPAVIAYTSGTTGRPKGVVHTHGGINAQLELLRATCGFDRTWRSYVAIPLFSLHGFLPQVAALLSVGGSVVLDDKFAADRLAAVSRRHALHYTTLSSPMVPQLLELPAAERPDFSHLRLLSCGGAPLHPDVRSSFEEAFGIHLTQGYACTEVLGAFVMDIDGTAPHGAAGRALPGGWRCGRSLGRRRPRAPTGRHGRDRLPPGLRPPELLEPTGPDR